MNDNPIKIWFSVMNQQIRVQEWKITEINEKLEVLPKEDYEENIHLQISLIIHTQIMRTKRDAVAEMKCYLVKELKKK